MRPVPLGSLGPYSRAAARRTRVEVFAKDARVVRGASPKGPTPRPRTAAQKEARRGRIGDMSAKSRRELLFRLRNAPDLRFYVTLTYPPSFAPTDDRVAKGHLARFTDWLRRRKVSLVWKEEFCDDGRPHFHVATDAAVDERAARKRWAAIVGCPAHRPLVVAAPIRDRTAVEWYTAKRRGHGANRVPEGYRNMGRWWGARGPAVAPTPLATFEGEEAAVAKVVRAIRKVEGARRAVRRVDRGEYGRTFYGVGGPALCGALSRYARSVGVDVRDGPGRPREGAKGSDHG